MQENAKSHSHKILMESREQLSLTGIKKVHSFAPKEIVLETVQGLLSIKGTGLGVKHLDLQGGMVEIDGVIDSLVYAKNSGERQNLLGRIFR